MHRDPDDDGLNGANAPHPLIRLLRDPAAAPSLGARDWARVVFAARRSALLGRVAVGLRHAGCLEALPERPRSYLKGGLGAAETNRRTLMREVRVLEGLLAPKVRPLVLLKGMAYAAAGLPVAEGRRASDVDILVPRADLARVETTLLASGWAWAKGDPYDQRYYRAWMHELPPLQNVERGIVTDVHHAILPLTGRIRPDPEALLARACAIPGTPWSVLAPADMVVHGVVHLFQDGDLSNGLRDLVDIDGLLRHFGTEPAFWNDLESQVSRLGVGRPWFHAARHVRALLGTPIPERVLAHARAWAPPWPVRASMNRLISSVLRPVEPDGAPPALAGFLLYARSHWLRMPPLMLARHLARKALKSERS